MRTAFASQSRSQRPEKSLFGPRIDGRWALLSVATWRQGVPVATASLEAGRAGDRRQHVAKANDTPIGGVPNAAAALGAPMGRGPIGLAGTISRSDVLSAC